ncbi:MAG: 30S ribosomal protein S4 [Candidatus Aenigmarchaeota archaeon]|nr:30S ribosomal protein S4 [Candidatus Aenigmarchaeota archaeon]
MGHPKKQRSKYETPKRPYDKSRIERERKLLQDYGLRRKKEIWRAESILRNFRRRARDLQAKRDEKLEKELLGKLNKLGIRVSSVDDVLGVGLENILSRRLQTIVYKRGIANSARHARQLITHGHVHIDDRKVVWPSYLVSSHDETRIKLNPRIRTEMIKENKGK